MMYGKTFIILHEANMIKIYNPINKQNIELKSKKISIYNCGPTVYNYVHIGNVRPLITFDVLYRYLLSLKKDVIYLHNITDIDDKIIKQAQELKLSEKQISEKYTKAYFELFKLLNIKKMQTSKVSQHIKDIILHIKKLIKKGYAYAKDGDVYFDIRKLKDYGHISNQNLKDLLDGVRKENLENKNYPLDFTLWKKTSVGLNWESPWSKGRPGWHTECAVLINKYIGKCATIHGGGIDLKFPHHENENAQNEALNNCDIAKIWMHVGHVNIDNEKMAKSLKNYVLVKDIINKDNANGLRWFFYKTKYENPINFNIHLLNEATDEINKIIHSMSQIETILIGVDQIKKEQCSLPIDFKKIIDDDLNFPNTITFILNQVKNLNQAIREKQYSKANGILCALKKEFDILGLTYNFVHYKNLSLIKNWDRSVREKKYKKADMYRKQLIKKGLL